MLNYTLIIYNYCNPIWSLYVNDNGVKPPKRFRNCTLRFCDLTCNRYGFGGKKIDTHPKTNTEPQNGTLEKKMPFGNQWTIHALRIVASAKLRFV